MAPSIRVDTSIVAADQTSAKSMANMLTGDTINAELGKNDLPRAEILDPAQVAFRSSAASSAVAGSHDYLSPGSRLGWWWWWW